MGPATVEPAAHEIIRKDAIETAAATRVQSAERGRRAKEEAKKMAKEMKGQPVKPAEARASVSALRRDLLAAQLRNTLLSINRGTMDRPRTSGSIGGSKADSGLVGVRVLSVATRNATHELLERARTSLQADEDGAFTKRSARLIQNQERLGRLSHMDSVDRAVRRHEKQTALQQNQHRYKQQWETETAMKLARETMVGAMRTNAVRPVLTSASSLHRSPLSPTRSARRHRVHHERSLSADASAEALTLRVIMPPSDKKPHVQMLPKTIRGARRLQSASNLPRVLSKERLVALASNPAILPTVLFSLLMQSPHGSRPSTSPSSTRRKSVLSYPRPSTSPSRSQNNSLDATRPSTSPSTTSRERRPSMSQHSQRRARQPSASRKPDGDLLGGAKDTVYQRLGSASLHASSSGTAKDLGPWDAL